MNAEPNPYAAPDARVEDIAVDAAATHRFYVVAPRKYLVLSIVTMNWYGVYWFYRNWKQLNLKHKDYWPIPRAIFAVFFTHALFAEVEDQLRRVRRRVEWSPSSLATLCVVATIAERIADRLAGRIEFGVRDTLLLIAGSFAAMSVNIWTRYRAQLAINVADGDPAGTSNASITGANIVWIVLGSFLWLLNLIGFLMIAGIIQIPQ